MIIPFFTTLFPQPEDGRDLGYVVVHIDPDVNNVEDYFFSWPSEKNALEAFCLSNTDRDVYTTTALFTDRSNRRASNIAHQWTVHADSRTLDLNALKVEPTMIVETSPGRHHLYWVTSTDDPTRLTEVARSVAHTHAGAGCNEAGWDLGQLLRVPGTANTDENAQGVFDVKLVRQGELCPIDLLEKAYPPVEVRVPVLVGEPMPSSTPGGGVIKEATQALSLNTEIDRLFRSTPQEDQDWSGTIQRMLSEMSRMGVSKEAAFYLAWNAACNKYERNKRSPEELWQELCEVYSNPENIPVRNSLEAEKSLVRLGEEKPDRSILEEDERNPEKQAKRFVESISLLTPDEMLQVSNNTFVDEYERWAATQTDSPTTYHRAGALTLLSSIFGEWGCCPTKQKTNLTLWFLMLGPTTRARKTTSMMLWVDLLEDMREREFNYILASDVTPESLMRWLPSRDGRTSVVYRDEAHGWLYEQSQKRYLVGLPELMTELYNGRVRARLRAVSDTTDEDSQPKSAVRTNFIQFLCGTTEQITRELTIQKYESGEMPRYLIAEADAPPLTRESMWFDQYDGGEDGEDIQRTALLNSLSAAKEFWRTRVGQRSPVRVPFEPQAWKRYMDARADIVEMAQKHDKADVMIPTSMRMADSLMKAAVLLAMADRETSVQMPHVLKAISLAEEWYASAVQVLGKILHSSYAAHQEEILAAIRSRPDGITQQELYSRFGRRFPEKEIETHLSVLIKARDIRKNIKLGRIRYIPVKRSEV